ncbi:MAG TPA: AIR synthase-related protein, partial [Pyrinomonadaceae bacterium]
KAIEPGDVLLALPSVGLHTNGYSLARKLFFEVAGYEPQTHVPELGMTAGEALLQPHVSYLRPLNSLLDREVIKGLAHITGGGLTDNIPRILPEGTAVQIVPGSWPVLPIFELFRRHGNVSDFEMFRTFNMGVGMVIVCSPSNATIIKAHFEAFGDAYYEIGKVIPGAGEVLL